MENPLRLFQEVAPLRFEGQHRNSNSPSKRATVIAVAATERELLICNIRLQATTMIVSGSCVPTLKMFIVQAFEGFM